MENKYYFKNDDYIQNDLLINYKSDKSKIKYVISNDI